MDPKISKEKQIFLFFFNVFFWNLCVLSKKNKKNLCVFPISYTCLHVFSDKYKYVLFHLNMLRLFLEISIFFLWN